MRGWQIDTDVSDPDLLDLRSRTQDRLERKASETELQEMAEFLLGLAEKQLALLPLDEPTLLAVRDTRRITSMTARKRGVRRVRQGLRDIDIDAVKAAIEGRHEEQRGATGAPGSWLKLLEEQGEKALDRFMLEHPAGDRQQLRTLLRQLQRSPADKKGKARRQLQRALGGSQPSPSTLAALEAESQVVAATADETAGTAATDDDEGEES